MTIDGMYLKQTIQSGSTQTYVFPGVDVVPGSQFRTASVSNGTVTLEPVYAANHEVVIGADNLYRTRAAIHKLAREARQPGSFTAPVRCTLMGMGDSLADRVYANIFPVLQAEHEYGGFYSTVDSTPGTLRRPNDASISPSTSTIVADPENGPFTSPIGHKEVFSTGELAYYSIGNANAFVQSLDLQNVPLTGVSEIVVFYTKTTSAGHFKVESSATTNFSGFADVTGASDVDAASGATTTRELGTLRLTGLDLTIGYLKISHVSGSDVEIHGLGMLRSTGVVSAWFSRGGMQMDPAFDNPSDLLRDLIDEISPDAMFLTFLDSDPLGGDHETYIDSVMDKFDAIWDAAAKELDVVYIGPNYQSTNSSRQDIDNKILRTRAYTNSKTFIDVTKVLGTHANATAIGLMADSIHPTTYAHLITASHFFTQSGLIAWPGKLLSDELQDTYLTAEDITTGTITPGSGDIDFSTIGGNPFDQDLNTDDAVVFASATFTGLADGRIPLVSAGGALISSNNYRYDGANTRVCIGANVSTIQARMHLKGGGEAVRIQNADTDGFRLFQFNTNTWRVFGLNAAMRLELYDMILSGRFEPPTSDPGVAGVLWNDAGTPKISAG